MTDEAIGSTQGSADDGTGATPPDVAFSDGDGSPTESGDTSDTGGNTSNTGGGIAGDGTGQDTSVEADPTARPDDPQPDGTGDAADQPTPSGNQLSTDPGAVYRPGSCYVSPA
ncbi:MAG: hypothetical protein ACR2QK_21215, partial [Acidimicrobiales bacterium]